MGARFRVPTAHDDRVADVPDDTARRLYATPPDRFIAERDEVVAQARAAGDRDAARQLAKLRRPTIAAWLVNLLAIRRPELISRLGDLASALRTAQRELRGGQLRELSVQRRELVAALVREAAGLALAADPDADPGRLPLAEVESTLNAALSDEGVAAEVAAGRLVRAVAYAGFGEVPRPRLRLVTGGAGGDGEQQGGSRRAGDPRPGSAPGAGRASPGAGGRPAGRTAGGIGGERPDPAGGAQPAGDVAAAAGSADDGAVAGAGDDSTAEAVANLAALRQALAAARTAGERAEADLERAVQTERDGAAALAAIEARLADLERRRSAAEQELRRLKLARRAAERAVVAARRRVGDAEGAIEAAEAAIGPERAGEGGNGTG